MTHIETGTIFRRDYGVSIRKATGPAFFASPSRYALGTFALEDSDALHARIAQAANERGLDPEVLTQQFARGLKARFNTAESLSGLALGLEDVKRYGSARFAGVVRSRSEPSDEHLAQLKVVRDRFGALYAHNECPCPDQQWNKGKEIDSVCAHTAALAIALERDQRSREPSAENLTGLTPKARGPRVALPFHLSDEAVTDLVLGYVVERNNHAELNREALRNPAIYDSALVDRIFEGSAEFRVIRQRAASVERASLPEPEQRLYGAINALVARTRETLQRRGFAFTGYSLVFPDSVHERVARRFQKGDSVYELATENGELPLIVQKQLGEVSPTWYASSDVGGVYPRNRGLEEQVDDSTRRVSRMRVLVPQQLGIWLPQSLKKAYER